MGVSRCVGVALGWLKFPDDVTCDGMESCGVDVVTKPSTTQYAQLVGIRTRRYQLSSRTLSKLRIASWRSRVKEGGRNHV